MNVLPKTNGPRSIGTLAVLVAASFSLPALAETIVYKLIDDQGRVTYSNTPLKGGVKIELEPITVIPSTPSGSLQTVPKQAVATVTPVPQAVAIVTPVSPPIATPLPPAAITAIPIPAPIPAPAPAAAAAAIAPAPQATLTQIPAVTTASSATAFKVAAMEAVSQARRDEVRASLRQEEEERVERLLAGAQAQLEEEQGRSENIRALRAIHATSAESAAATGKPQMTKEVRQMIERHFERIRQLQDEITMHEDNLARLRARAEATRVSSSN